MSKRLTREEYRLRYEFAEEERREAEEELEALRAELEGLYFAVAELALVIRGLKRRCATDAGE